MKWNEMNVYALTIVMCSKYIMWSYTVFESMNSAENDGDGNELSLGTISGIMSGGIVIIIIGGGMLLLVIFLFKKKTRTESVGTYVILNIAQ